nr:MAG TPA: hypothetical protein [Caudoviricetes sp.]
MFLCRVLCPLNVRILWQMISERMRWLVEYLQDYVGWMQMVIVYHRHWQK